MRRILLVLVLAFFWGVSAFGTESGIYLNLDQVDVKTLVQFLAKELGKNVVYDETLKGKITVISKKPVSPETAWRMITEALGLIGATVYKESTIRN